MKKGELQTTQDICQKFQLGILEGNEIWAFEEIGLEEAEWHLQIKNTQR